MFGDGNVVSIRLDCDHFPRFRPILRPQYTVSPNRNDTNRTPSLAEKGARRRRHPHSRQAVAWRAQARSFGTCAPIELPRAINQRWSLDFVSDTLADGRRFRILRIVDDFSRECLATVVDTSLSGVRVVRELERLSLERATPTVIVSDNGTELTVLQC